MNSVHTQTKRPAVSKYRLGPRKQQHKQVLAKMLQEVQPTPINWESALTHSGIVVIAWLLIVGVVKLFLS